MFYGKIYVLKSPISLKVRYVGFTTKSLNRRLGAHINEAKSSKKSTKKNNWIKYLLNINKKPLICLVEYCNANNWEVKEKYWISHYGLSNLKNETIGGLTPMQTKECIIKANKTRLANRGLIFQLNENKVILKTWNSVSEIQQYLNTTSSGNFTNALHKGTRSYNYYWCYEKDYPNFKLKEYPRRKIYQYNFSGELIKIWDNLQDAMAIYGTYLSYAARNGGVSKGYLWSYAPKDCKKLHNLIIATNSENTVLNFFKSIKECAAYYNIDQSSVSWSIKFDKPIFKIKYKKILIKI